MSSFGTGDFLNMSTEPVRTSDFVFKVKLILFLILSSYKYCVLLCKSIIVGECTRVVVDAQIAKAMQGMQSKDIVIVRHR